MSDRDHSEATKPDEEEVAEVVPLPGVDDTVPEEEPDPIDWDEAIFSGRTLEDFTSEDYVSSSTEEYRYLAEEVSRAAEEKWEQQAVAATMAGVESGLVGFGDVSGAQTEPEESYEAIEQAASSDLAMRVGSAVVIFGMFLGSVLLGGWWFSGFVILVMVVSAGELYATLRTAGYRPLALFGLLGVVLMGVGAHLWGSTAIGGWAALVAAATILFFSLAQKKEPLENAATTILGMVWVGMLSFAILIASGPRPAADILFVVLVIALNDMGAYFVGRAFGKRPLAPRLSPHKTMRGLVAGLITGAVAATVIATFPAWQPIGVARALAIAAVVGVVAPLGDLAESMVKRSIGVKDMGSVLPGHGGMLDRIDGFLFAVPVVYFLFRGFGLL